MNKKSGNHTSSFRIELSPTTQEGVQEGETSTGSKASANDKRAAQNRAAQRAFRQRKEQHIKDLENKAQQYESLVADNEKLKIENEHLWDIIDKVQSGRDIQGLNIPIKTLRVSDHLGGHFESTSFSKVAPNTYVEAKSSDMMQYSVSSLSKSASRSSEEAGKVSYNILYRSTNLNTQSNMNDPYPPYVMMPSNMHLTSDGFKSTSPPAPIDSHLVCEMKSAEQPKSAPSSVVAEGARFLSSSKQRLPLASPKAVTQHSEPHGIFSADNPNLAFLQYGWLYDSATVQDNYCGSYCEVTGMTPAEVSFNDRVMDDLYSLLELGALDHNEASCHSSVASQSEVVGIT